MKTLIRFKNDKFIHINDIKRVEFGCACWATLWLWSQDEPITIGNGSYYNDGKHVSHWVVEFSRFKKILTEYLLIDDCEPQSTDYKVKPLPKAEDIVFELRQVSSDFLSIKTIDSFIAILEKIIPEKTDI